ncbi:hypothetical protein [Streptomyces sp. NPDC097981]|uniref:hypothetical protein n=1 Tax=Streptomyces sp. NPDC097981 TaxID=3155428 RepID=UPI003329AC92
MEGVSFSWTRKGRKPFVLARKGQRPPSKVVFSDPRIRALVEGVPESALLIGLERGDKVVSVDLDAESPHVLVNAGTGGGESVILRTIAAQLIHHGAQGDVEEVAEEVQADSRRRCGQLLRGLGTEVKDGRQWIGVV